MISFDDFKDPAYRKACIDAGEWCYRCDASIVFGNRTNSRRLCFECSELDRDKDKVSHSNLIRCPKCKHQENVSEGDQYTFKSPPLLAEEEKAEESEEAEPEVESLKPLNSATR